MEEKVLCICTTAKEDLEKASMPFVMSNAALAMDVAAMVVLQGQGVWLAKKGYVDNLEPGGGFPPLKKLMTDFLELGGKLRVCGPCIKFRNIAETDLVNGAEVTAAGVLLDEALTSKAVFNY